MVSFPQVSPPCMHLFFPNACHMPCPFHPPWFGHPHNILWAARSWSSSLCSLLHSPVTSSLLDPNTVLSTLFSNRFNICSSHNVRDQVSHPYKRRQNYSFVYFNICISGQQTGSQKTLDRMTAAFHEFNLTLVWLCNVIYIIKIV